jgi:hypothetical protein
LRKCLSGVSRARTEIEILMRSAVAHSSRSGARALLACLACLFGLAVPACAHQAGKGAAQGAAETVAAGQQANAEDPSKQITRVAAERAVAGAIAELDAPEQREKLRQVMSELMTEAIASAFRTATTVPPGARGPSGGPGVSPVAELLAQAARAGIETALHQVVVDLGGNGEGPLAHSIASTGKQVSAGVVGSALDRLTELFPGCRGPNAVDCIDRQLQATTHAAGAGFAKGVSDTVGWQLMLGVGLAGLAAGIVAHWLWSLRTQTRLLRPRTT